MSALFETFEQIPPPGEPDVVPLTPLSEMRADPKWCADIQRYRDNMTTVTKLTLRQTELMEIVRMRRSQDAVARIRQSAVLPDPQQHESALPAWARQMLKDTPETKRQAPLLLGPAEELTALDAKIADIREEMAHLEANILTKDPENSLEAQHMLRFISTVLLAGSNMDAEYLGDLLEACADVCDQKVG